MPPDRFTTSAGVTYTKVNDDTWESEAGVSISRERAAQLAATATSSVGSSDPIFRNFPDGSLRRSVDGGESWTVIGEAPTKEESGSSVKNLGAGVFEDETGYYTTTRVPAPGGRGGTVEEKQYITKYEADRILKGEGGDGGTSGPTASQVTAAGNLNTRRDELAENRRQFDVEQERMLRDFLAEQQIALDTLAESIRANQASENAVAANLDFLRQKEAFAQTNDNKRLVMETQAQLFNQQAALSTLQTQRATLEFNYQSTAAQMKQAADQFNASMGFNVEQANVAAAAQKRAELAQAARDIGELSASPTDFGRLAAFSLASTPWGQEDAAIQQGEGFITDESLSPLEAALRNREDVQAQPERPFSYSPVQAPQMAPLNLPSLNFTSPDLSFLDKLATQPTITTETVEQTPRGTLETYETATGKAGKASAGQFTEEELDAFIRASSPAGTAGALPRKADGGMVEGAYLGDEEGAEIHIPLAAGVSYVIDAEKTKKMSPEKRRKLRKMAAGGIFAEGIFEGLGSDRTRARGFQTEASRRARASTPWATGVLPGATFASSPGLAPEVIDLLAALRAQEIGEPADYFRRRAALMAPAGMNERVIGRSR